MKTQKYIVSKSLLVRFVAVLFAPLGASTTIASEVPAGWESNFFGNTGQIEVVPSTEAAQIRGAIGPAAVVLIPAAVGGATGVGAYLAGTSNPSVEGALVAGAMGATSGAATALPGVGGIIVGGTAAIGGAAATRVIDSRPTSQYGSFPPGIGSASNCTPWTCSWKDGQPVPYGTPGSTNH